MPINTELQKWLAEKAIPAMSPEEQQVFNSLLAKEAVAEQFNRAWMAPPDYNRKMNELKEKESLLEQELKNHVATLNAWKSTEQAKVDKAYSDYQSAQAELADLRRQMTEEGLQPPAPRTPAAQPPTPNGNGHQKYMSQEEALKLVQAELSKAAFLPALTAQIIENHRQLFGNVPDMTKVTDQALRTGKSLQDTWRELYKVSDKEHEMQEASIQKRIDEGISERLAKLQSDGAMGQNNFSGRPEPPSPIRQMIAAQREANANSPLAVPAPVMQQSESVNAAVEALRSGKFAVKYPGQS